MDGDLDAGWGVGGAEKRSHCTLWVGNPHFILAPASPAGSPAVPAGGVPRETAFSWEFSRKAGRHRGSCSGLAVCSDRLGLGAMPWVSTGGTRGAGHRGLPRVWLESPDPTHLSLQRESPRTGFSATRLPAGASSFPCDGQVTETDRQCPVPHSANFCSNAANGRIRAIPQWSHRNENSQAGIPPATPLDRKLQLLSASQAAVLDSSSVAI